MIKIQHHCTPKQARQICDAIKSAGLEYPPIDWAFYLTNYVAAYHDGFIRLYPQHGGKMALATRDDVNQILEEWEEYDYENCKEREDYPLPTFIPCPTLAELIFLFHPIAYDHESRQFETYIDRVLNSLTERSPRPRTVKLLSKHWSKLQEETQ